MYNVYRKMNKNDIKKKTKEKWIERMWTEIQASDKNQMENINTHGSLLHEAEEIVSPSVLHSIWMTSGWNLSLDWIRYFLLNSLLIFVHSIYWIPYTVYLIFGASINKTHRNEKDEIIIQECIQFEFEYWTELDIWLNVLIK